jgi:hypothetical protein
MTCKVVNERWKGRHLLCDVVLDDLAVLGVTVSGSAYDENVKTWFNPAVPKGVKDEIERAVLVIYRVGIQSRLLMPAKVDGGSSPPSSAPLVAPEAAQARDLP